MKYRDAQYGELRYGDESTVIRDCENEQSKWVGLKSIAELRYSYALRCATDLKIVGAFKFLVGKTS